MRCTRKLLRAAGTLSSDRKHARADETAAAENNAQMINNDMLYTAIQVLSLVEIQLLHSMQEGHYETYCRACSSRLQTAGVPVEAVGDVGAELQHKQEQTAAAEYTR